MTEGEEDPEEEEGYVLEPRHTGHFSKAFGFINWCQFISLVLEETGPRFDTRGQKHWKAASSSLITVVSFGGTSKLGLCPRSRQLCLLTPWDLPFAGHSLHLDLSFPICSVGLFGSTPPAGTDVSLTEIQEMAEAVGMKGPRSILLQPQPPSLWGLLSLP